MNDTVQSKKSADKKATHVCGCGCGGHPRGAKSRFLPGHDARMRIIDGHAASRLRPLRRTAVVHKTKIK